MDLTADTIERAIEALDYRIRVVQTNPDYNSDNFIGKLLREGRQADQTAKEKLIQYHHTLAI